MTKDELIREINSCTSWHVVCHDGNTINIIAESEDTFMEFPDDVEYLEDISVNWEALKTAKNRSLGNAYALLNLINDYVSTPIKQRSLVGYTLSQQKNNSFDETRKNIRAITGCHIDGSVGPTYELPQNGVIITLNNGQKLHGKRAYDDIRISDFEDTAIDFGNFIIPTAHIQSIQKCGDGNDD